MTLELPLLLAWGTLVGLDLVSAGQAMIARPLVAGTVAGAIAGDPLAGGMVGAALELFALSVLPVGGARFPDYGVGAVAGAAIAAGAPGIFGLGLGGAVGLAVAYAGEHGIQLVRRATTGDVHRQRARLDQGDPVTIAAVHRRGLARDAARAFVMTAVGLALAELVRWLPVSVRGAVLLTAVVAGAGLGVGLAAGIQLAGGRARLRWVALGLAGGIALVLWR